MESPPFCPRGGDRRRLSNRPHHPVLERLTRSHSPIAICSCLTMHETNDARQCLGVALGKDAMPEIEDVPRSPTRPIQHVADAGLDRRPGCKHQRGIEIPLDGDLRTKTLPGNVEWLAPIDADGSAPAAAYLSE